SPPLTSPPFVAIRPARVSARAAERPRCSLCLGFVLPAAATRMVHVVIASTCYDRGARRQVSQRRRSLRPHRGAALAVLASVQRLVPLCWFFPNREPRHH